MDDGLALDRAIEVVDLDGDVGDGLDQWVKIAVGFEAQPLHAELGPLLARAPHLELGRVALALTPLDRRDAEVVVLVHPRGAQPDALTAMRTRTFMD
jgi:hypothetical protein